MTVWYAISDSPSSNNHFLRHVQYGELELLKIPWSILRGKRIGFHCQYTTKATEFDMWYTYRKLRAGSVRKTHDLNLSKHLSSRFSEWLFVLHTDCSCLCNTSIKIQFDFIVCTFDNIICIAIKEKSFVVFAKPAGGIYKLTFLCYTTLREMINVCLNI